MNIYDVVKTLRARVYTEVLPTDDSRPSFEDYAAYYEWKPRSEASAFEHIVISTKDVEVGDLVIVVENRKYRGAWQYNVVSADETLRSVARDAERLYVVTAKSGQRLTIEHQYVNGLWEDAPGFDVMGSVQTVNAYADARRIIKTGMTFEEYKARVEAHPDYARYVALFAEAKSRLIKDREEQDAEAKAAKIARQPLVDAAKQASTALGFGIVKETPSYRGDGFEMRLGYMGTNDARALLTLALAGRLALGEISQEEHDAAVATVESAILDK